MNDRIGWGGLVLWEHEGRPVSLAGRNRAAAGQARVGPVYTPPELRGRGFGGAATAAITQAALDDGAEGVVLFTDLANPASNTLYQRLGYRPVSDWTVIRFGAPGNDEHGDVAHRGRRTADTARHATAGMPGRYSQARPAAAQHQPGQVTRAEPYRPGAGVPGKSAHLSSDP